jgi:F0F1-type ATP synthase assembly protein I
MAKTSPRVEKTTSQTSIFISMALDMTWRMAFVVLVPIIGGFELDKWLDTTPVFTITGFVLAMVGVGLVLWQTMQTANNVQMPKKDKN